MFGTACVCAAALCHIADVLKLCDVSSAYNIQPKNALWAERRNICVKPGGT